MTVTGTVQGVGFRPHVYRLATQLGLTGQVGNDTGSVFIELQGPSEALRAFRRRLVNEQPPLAHVDTVAIVDLPVDDRVAGSAAGFGIVDSRQVAGPVTTAPPDSAACPDCLAELMDPSDRRYRYPFITCTNCGPRFTIITALPYDRPATTMADFPLCDPCDREYHDPADRRFHAQPVACEVCGPRLRLRPVTDSADGADEATEAAGAADRAPRSDAILAAVQSLLADGAIVAVKGIGGFHLACRADDETTVANLRERKQRPGKPFAVMARDLATARRLAHISDTEAAVLASTAAPIVLLHRRVDAPLAPSVAPGNPWIGVMLPSSPLHHLLLHEVPGTGIPVSDVLVMTSGNLAEEPLCIDDEEAQQRLARIADAFLLHDRPIAVPCDDSVVRVDQIGADAVTTVIRRSRGYVPASLPLPFEGVPAMAVGGQLKNVAGLTDGRRVWLSAHIGDMSSLPTLRAFERTVERFAAMHQVTPDRLVADAHPDYTTRRWAVSHADGRPVVEVQHHHAHIASVMAEHGVDEPVLGIAFDGTGYGPDGTIWGGEVLLADYDGFERLAHLSPVMLPGGDAAIRHPRRVALSHLRSAGIPWEDDLPAVAATPPDERALLATQLDRGLRCVPTSSMGRLFDAVASLIGVRHDITFEAQAAIELEVLASVHGANSRPGAVGAPRIHLPLVRTAAGQPMHLDAGVLVREVVTAFRAGVAPALIARWFHEAAAGAIVEVAREVRERGGPQLVALSGGVFTNALLSRLAARALTESGFTVLRHRLVPPNDGGLALGQLAVGARGERNAATGRPDTARSPEARLDPDPELHPRTHPHDGRS
jgi:hydrogenase maturation protein HypF